MFLLPKSIGKTPGSQETTKNTNIRKEYLKPAFKFTLFLRIFSAVGIKMTTFEFNSNGMVDQLRSRTTRHGLKSSSQSQVGQSKI